MGQFVKNGTFNSTIDVSQFQSGIYFVRIDEINGTDSKTLKFIKE
jgi:hypothetical protein